MSKKYIKWSDLYENYNYSTKCKNFIKKMSNARLKYDKIESGRLCSLSHTYLNFFEKTINIANTFLKENLLFSYNTSDIVKHILYTNILNDGICLYYMYRGMQNLKKNKFIIPKKYLSQRYLNVFSELDTFFIKRIEKEKNYDMVK